MELVMFNKNTEYAVIILRELKKVKEEGKNVCSLETVAKATGLKIGFAEQIGRKLRISKLISSVRGPGGGYAITEKALALTLWELMEIVEPAIVSKSSKLLPTTKHLYDECVSKIKDVYIYS